MNNKLVFGTDPEFFAGYKQDNELFVLPPAWFREYGNVPFSPDEKHPIFLDAMEKHGVLIMEDGAAFEETILPSTDWRELYERANLGKELLSKFILSKFPNVCLPEVQTVPTIKYDVNRWSNESKAFQMCLIFGCDQDFDADEGGKGGETIDALKHGFRYGGGHIHVSGSAKIKEEPILAIQSLKLTAGLAAVAFSDTPELDKARTYLYGRPAKFRPQQYKKEFQEIPNTKFGVEYRTPSNRWTNSLEHAEKLFKWVEIGIRNLLEDGLVLELLPQINVPAREAIVNCDQKSALDLLAFVESKI